jgi:aminoglycoside phosphotransferase (APT) family kinase protein
MSPHDSDASLASVGLSGLNTRYLDRWLAESLEGFTSPLMSLTAVGAGRSNLTLRARDVAGRSVILRRPPLGRPLDSAHDVLREARIMSGLAQSAVPVPRVMGTCSNSKALGAPFYAMEFVSGSVLDKAMDVTGTPLPDRKTLAKDVFDVLGRLHTTDLESVGLAAISPPTDYVERQLRRWQRQWLASGDRESTLYQECVQQLDRKRPRTTTNRSLLHGDFRLANLMVRVNCVAAVLDWELAAIGDPLADLAYLLNTWVDGKPTQGPIRSATEAGGFGSRDTLTRQYARMTGFDLEHLPYFRSFSYWRSAAIREGVCARYDAGTRGPHNDFDLQELRASVDQLLEYALRTVRS